MNNIAILGAQIGDEGKARVINTLAKDYDIVVRFSGGQNAGHTLYYKGQKIVRRALPSADFSVGNKAFLGSGMVLNLEKLIEEVKLTLELFPQAKDLIYIDPAAFVVKPEHIEQDIQKNKHIGSTGNGITPAYLDKVGRTGARVLDLVKDNADVIDALKDLGVQFKHSLEMKNEFLNSKVIFEGAQSVVLDYNHGTYPFVTSGEAALGGIHNAGFSFMKLNKVYGVAKAYSTKVGNGPFPTEYFGEEADDIRTRGFEWGSATGRPRRIGTLDLPFIRYSRDKGGLTHLVITKLDILNGNEYIKVCHEYDKEPTCGDDFNYAKPKYCFIPGWKDAKDPNETKEFINFIEYQTGLKVEYVSCGVNEEDFYSL